jgi:hypothetical protein
MCETAEDLAKNNQEQIAEMLGHDNKYYAGLALGHDPSPDEAARHYVEHGGCANFRQRKRQQHQHTN